MQQINLKHESPFDRIFALAFGIVLSITLLSGCSKDNDPSDEENNKSPHKVRIEINHPRPDMYEVFFSGSYKYDNMSYDLKEDGTYSFPLSMEVDIPREFESLSFGYSRLPIIGKTYEEEEIEEVIDDYVSVNVYIDEHLIVSGAPLTMVCVISNKVSENKFSVVHGRKMYKVNKGTSLGKNEDFGKSPYRVRIEVASEYPGTSVSLMPSYIYQHENYEIIFNALTELEIYNRPLPFSAEFEMYRSFLLLQLFVQSNDNKDFTVKLFVDGQLIDRFEANKWDIFSIDSETLQEVLTK
jgi:hypothetical protein